MADGGIIHRTKEKDKGTYCAAKISFMIVHYNATESALRNFCMHKHTWRLIDTINGAKASALVYSIVKTAKENGVNRDIGRTLRSGLLSDLFRDFNYLLA